MLPSGLLPGWAVLWQSGAHPVRLPPRPCCSPSDSYAWLPGSTACVRCIKGLPTVCSGSDCGATASSPGTHIVNVGTVTGTPLTGDYELLANTGCTGWGTSLKLALEVGGDCSITISPITDTSCAQPSADGYNDLLIQAYYTSATAIRSLLPASTGGVSSYLLAIDQDTGDAALTMEVFAATTLPAQAATAQGKVSGGRGAACAAGLLAAMDGPGPPAGHVC